MKQSPRYSSPQQFKSIDQPTPRSSTVVRQLSDLSIQTEQDSISEELAIPLFNDSGRRKNKHQVERPIFVNTQPGNSSAQGSTDVTKQVTELSKENNGVKSFFHNALIAQTGSTDSDESMIGTSTPLAKSSKPLSPIVRPPRRQYVIKDGFDPYEPPTHPRFRNSVATCLIRPRELSVEAAARFNGVNEFGRDTNFPDKPRLYTFPEDQPARIAEANNNKRSRPHCTYLEGI